MTPEQRKDIDAALHSMREIAGRDKWCDKELDCMCEICSAAEAVKKLESALGKEHKGYWSHRLTSNKAERVYAEAWEIANEEHDFMYQWKDGQPMLEEYKAAASVIQWLGTNCGQSYLHECRRELNKVSHEYGHLGYSWSDVFTGFEKFPDDVTKVAHMIACTFYEDDTQNYNKLMNGICKAARLIIKQRMEGIQL